MNENLMYEVTCAHRGAVLAIFQVAARHKDGLHVQEALKASVDLLKVLDAIIYEQDGGGDYGKNS